MSENIESLSYCARIISLNIMSSSSIHVDGNDRILSFLWLNNILLYACTPFPLTIHLPWLPRLIPYLGSHEYFCGKHANPLHYINSTSFGYMPSIYPYWLATMVILFLVFWENSVLSSVMAVLVYVLINSVWESPFSTALPACVIFFLLWK
jgi:hypothetical protein